MPKICLCLTGPTIAQNLAALEHYRNKVDMVELRVDYLDPSEFFHVRAFPIYAGLPSIMTVRRKCDGGAFNMGEGVRLVLFARGLTYAASDMHKNFSYIDLEYDFRIPAIQEAARTFGIKIIRSRHFMNGLPPNAGKIWQELGSKPYEIPKLAVQAKSLADVDGVFRLFENEKKEHIALSMGEYGFCTRILAEKLGSSLVYAAGSGFGFEPAAPGQLEPYSLLDVYRIREYKPDWKIFGILGASNVLHSMSPAIHNKGFSELGINSLYLPFPADSEEAFLGLAERLDIQGFSVTAPYKEKILPYLDSISAETEAIGACNTVIRRGKHLAGYNTDAYGFSKAVKAFLNLDSLYGVKTTIIGAGGAARAVAFALKGLGARACIINRSMAKAKKLAETYGFEWSGMTERASELLGRYNDLIVQTSSVGLEGGSGGDPIEWYEFSGKEALFETIYAPPETILMKRAQQAGCRVTNGLGMLKAQAEAQFKLFSGEDYPL
ncbi:type I 3-dehydroquinate dehydratase [Spirochaetota bacterium]